MNILLLELFDKYNISLQNRFEIYQIYNLMPDNKKQNLLNNFSSLALRVNRIEEEIELEKEILISGAIERISIELTRQKEKKRKKISFK